MSEEAVIALWEEVSKDERLREQLKLSPPTPEAFGELARSMGFYLNSVSRVDELFDSDLDGATSRATDRTCFGTTDCCHTKHTCFGTTSCCH